MIKFITDVREGEPDILGPVVNADLVIKDLFHDRTITYMPAPPGGWSHELLECISILLKPLTSEGADAYIGSVWVGSTEV